MNYAVNQWVEIKLLNCNLMLLLILDISQPTANIKSVKEKKEDYKSMQEDKTIFSGLKKGKCPLWITMTRSDFESKVLDDNYSPTAIKTRFE